MDQATMTFEQAHIMALELRAEEIERCQTMPYADYLALPWWDFVRARALRRARGVCELCQEAHATEAHHTTYKRIGREKPDDMVALCRSCHEHVTRQGLDKLSRGDLLRRRREILHSPEFGRGYDRLDY